MAETPGVEPQALVVGAGPVGLTMACELLRHGVSCRIIDQNPGPSDEPRAHGIHARTLEVFEDMGIVDQVRAEGHPIHGLNTYADRGRLAYIGFDELETPYPFMLVLPQNRTERLLTAHLAHLGGQVEWGRKFTGLTQDERWVSATVADAGGREQDIRASWLVGCDGRESAVGAALGLSSEVASYPEAFVLADVRVNWHLPDDEAHLFLSPQGFMAAFPLPAGGWRLIADVTGEAPEEASLELVRNLLRERSATEVEVLEPTWISAYRIEHRMLPRYRNGRCFLAGDAAHLFSPVGGQSMNMGIQDAYNLAWKLAMVSRGQAREWLLDSYQAERLPIAGATYRATDLATKVVTLRRPASQQVRNQLGAFLGHFEVVQQRISRRLAALDFSYRKSSMVDEDRMPLLHSGLHARGAPGPPSLLECLDFGEAPKAGERAPDVMFDTPSIRLFEVLRGTSHTLLIFTGAKPGPEGIHAIQTVKDLVHRHYAEFIAAYTVVSMDMVSEDLPGGGPLLFDRYGTLHRRYGACSGGLYLIRPDGYVGYRSQPASAERLSAYLKRIFG